MFFRNTFTIQLICFFVTLGWSQTRTKIKQSDRYVVFYAAPYEGFPLIPNANSVDSNAENAFADSTDEWLSANPEIVHELRRQQLDSLLLNFEQILWFGRLEKEGKKTYFHHAQIGLNRQRDFQRKRSQSSKKKKTELHKVGDAYLLHPADFNRLQLEMAR